MLLYVIYIQRLDSIALFVVLFAQDSVQIPMVVQQEMCLNAPNNVNKIQCILPTLINVWAAIILATDVQRHSIILHALYVLMVTLW